MVEAVLFIRPCNHFGTEAEACIHYDVSREYLESTPSSLQGSKEKGRKKPPLRA